MTGHDANAGLRRVLEALTASEPADPVDVEALEVPPMPEHFDIEEALQNNWLEMWYQPKIDLRQKCLAGAEALARIRHPDYGVLLPATFVSGTTDDKLVPLTKHALLTTLRDWEVFDASGFNLRLAINLPVNHLLKLPIPTIVNEHRPAAEHWPGLIVEVTEDQIVREIKRAQEIANLLKISGITVSIDDFGAGYSSFHSLRELAFTELKLNYSFVKNCATDATNAAICQTAIDLAHRFGSAAVAEGIESMADLQALQIMGCDFGQGILLAPPMPLPQFLALLQQRMNRPRPAAPAEAPTVAA
ncbi:EAL domain-containing protein [Xanthobacteraceae bacterium Astr-EGSB]|uniref:EAL domain-containing protein n=1 Tax=Astrobacterium formosum TaxID=3069710 RepID=UPI0027B0DFFD|nr:EAL domain-containing protein [Xanthobacteraceae bacterium Astr-EGSB]